MMDSVKFPYTKGMRITLRKDYLRHAKQSEKFVGRWLFVDFKPSSFPSSRLGVTVSKRFGCAAVRNRFKRLIKEVFRLHYPQFTMSFDIVVRPRFEASSATFFDIEKELLHLIQRGCFACHK